MPPNEAVSDFYTLCSGGGAADDAPKAGIYLATNAGG